jgi:hypothetical protein
VATFGVATRTTTDLDAAPQVDTDDLCQELAQIRDSLGPLLSDSAKDLSLSSVDIALTLSASGKVWFIAEGAVEASITLTFSRPPERND